MQRQIPNSATSGLAITTVASDIQSNPDHTVAVTRSSSTRKTAEILAKYEFKDKNILNDKPIAQDNVFDAVGDVTSIVVSAGALALTIYSSVQEGTLTSWPRIISMAGNAVSLGTSIASRMVMGTTKDQAVALYTLKLVSDAVSIVGDVASGTTRLAQGIKPDWFKPTQIAAGAGHLISFGMHAIGLGTNLQPAPKNEEQAPLLPTVRTATMTL